MKTNKKVQKNNVQKSEKETAVKVTALAIIPKPMKLLTSQNMPTATEVTETPEAATAVPEMATVPTVTEEAPQQAVFKTPLATATAETDLDITTVHPSADNHRKTFKDASLQELAESIREVGILQAIAVRPRTEGGYEIIAGHTRKAACELAGLDTMPMFIRNLNDDEATIVMVDSNIQREDIFPSEKARAYSMRYYAMKHQGIKGDKGSSLDIMSEETGENAKKIQRYIRLAKLSDELLDFVDRKKIGFIQGVDLSYLNEEQQQWVLDIILDRNIFPNIEQSARLKASCRENMLTQEEVRNIMLPEQVLAKPRKVTFKADRLDDYFDEGYTEEKITEVIINLLDEWKKRGERA